MWKEGCQWYHLKIESHQLAESCNFEKLQTILEYIEASRNRGENHSRLSVMCNFSSWQRNDSPNGLQISKLQKASKGIKRHQKASKFTIHTNSARNSSNPQNFLLYFSIFFLLPNDDCGDYIQGVRRVFSMPRCWGASPTRGRDENCRKRQSNTKKRQGKDMLANYQRYIVLMFYNILVIKVS